MNTQQLDIFEQTKLVNPLKGKRVCLTGEFRMSPKELNLKLKAVGVNTIDRVSDTRVYKEGDTIPPVKETTHFFIVGTNPNEESMKRYYLKEGIHINIGNYRNIYFFLRNRILHSFLVIL